MQQEQKRKEINHGYIIKEDKSQFSAKSINNYVFYTMYKKKSNSTLNKKEILT